jgi:hypothetical protein
MSCKICQDHYLFLAQLSFYRSGVLFPSQSFMVLYFGVLYELALPRKKKYELPSECLTMSMLIAEPPQFRFCLFNKFDIILICKPRNATSERMLKKL